MHHNLICSKYTGGEASLNTSLLTVISISLRMFSKAAKVSLFLTQQATTARAGRGGSRARRVRRVAARLGSSAGSNTMSAPSTSSAPAVAPAVEFSDSDTNVYLLVLFGEGF